MQDEDDQGGVESQTYEEEESSGGDEGDQSAMVTRMPGRRGAKKKSILKDELARMMFGFGEVDNPRDDTLDLMETYVYEFVTNVIHRSLARSQRAGFAQIQVRDILKVIESDQKKYLRVPYILKGQRMATTAQKSMGKTSDGGFLAGGKL
jgi:hypothetical protein